MDARYQGRGSGLVEEIKTTIRDTHKWRETVLLTIKVTSKKSDRML